MYSGLIFLFAIIGLVVTSRQGTLRYDGGFRRVRTVDDPRTSAVGHQACQGNRPTLGKTDARRNGPGELCQDSRTQTSRPRDGSHRQTSRSEFENRVAVPAGSRCQINSRGDIGFLVRSVDPLEVTPSSKWNATCGFRISQIPISDILSHKKLQNRMAMT
jgi:hypothetical protein